MHARIAPDAVSATARDSATESPPSVFDGVKSLGSSLFGLAHDHLRLIALETRLAGESLVNMIAAGVVLAVLVVSAWLMLVAIGVILLVDSGVGLIVALLLAMAANLGVAFLLYKLIRQTSRHLGFPATIRSLNGKLGEEPTPAASEGGK